jgi:hypothetical protein
MLSIVDGVCFMTGFLESSTGFLLVENKEAALRYDDNR